MVFLECRKINDVIWQTKKILSTQTLYKSNINNQSLILHDSILLFWIVASSFIFPINIKFVHNQFSIAGNESFVLWVEQCSIWTCDQITMKTLKINNCDLYTPIHVYCIAIVQIISKSSDCKLIHILCLIIRWCSWEYILL